MSEAFIKLLRKFCWKWAEMLNHLWILYATTICGSKAVRVDGSGSGSGGSSTNEVNVRELSLNFIVKMEMDFQTMEFFAVYIFVFPLSTFPTLHYIRFVVIIHTKYKYILHIYLLWLQIIGFSLNSWHHFCSFNHFCWRNIRIKLPQLHVCETKGNYYEWHFN